MAVNADRAGRDQSFRGVRLHQVLAEKPYPDLQFHFLPMAVAYDGHSQANEHGYQAHVGSNLFKSRGSITLKSADPREKPRIIFNYLQHEDDRRDMRNVVRLTRHVMTQPAFDPYRGRAISPDDSIQSDDEIDAFVRDHAETAYHPCGACKMGRADDPMAVVDPQCRVIGVEACAWPTARSCRTSPMATSICPVS